MSLQINLELPEKAYFLLTTKSRYKVIYGGRGSAKSWSIARVLLVLALNNKIRILCTRELQISIRDSVHKLLKDQISNLDLDNFFYVTKESIRASNGSEFLFKGMKNNVQEIKSLEGIDICWVEEAARMSLESWEILTPTIRKENSEIWASFNPESVDDLTYKKFILQKPDNAIVEKINYDDNPWFNNPLLEEMEYDKKHNPELYDHKWLGNPKVINDAQIFNKKYEVVEFETPNIKDIKENRFFYGADWGFAQDPTVLIRCFIQGKVLYIDQEVCQRGVEILKLPELFNKIDGSKDGLIYGDSSRPDIISYLRGEGYNINPADKGDGSVKAGIDYIRDFEKVIIHPRCKNTVDEFKFYSYKVDRVTGEILPKIVDKYNHCFVGNTLITTNKGKVPIADIKVGDLVLTRKGFKRVLKKFNNGYKKVKTYHFANGKSLTATDTHSIITTKGDIQIKNINKNDKLYFNVGKCKFIESKNQRLQYTKAKNTADILIAKEELIECILKKVVPNKKTNIYIYKYIKIITEIFLLIAIFTIKTTTPLIMMLAICSLLKLVSIYQSMQKNIIFVIKILLKKSLIVLESLRLFGMVQKRVKNGIKSIMKITKINFTKSSKENALIAILNMNRVERKAAHTVQINASQHIEEKKDLMILQNNVKHAKNNLQAINTKELKHALENAQQVYDLMIEDCHEYFANDILVHNCVDSIRYALCKYIKRKGEIAVFSF